MHWCVSQPRIVDWAPWVAIKRAWAAIRYNQYRKDIVHEMFVVYEKCLGDVFEPWRYCIEFNFHLTCVDG